MSIFSLNTYFLQKNNDLLVILRVNLAASNEESDKINVGLNILNKVVLK